MASEFVPIPPPGKAESARDLERVLDARIRYDWMTGPIGPFSLWRYAELMDQSDQWVRRAFSSASGDAPWQWVSEEFVQGLEAPRLPVYNEGIASRMNETSRLARPRYRPVVRPNQDSPDARTRLACRRMTQALLSELDRMRFSTEADIGHYRMPVHGTWFLKSFWEQRWDETVLVPAKGSMACPNRGQGCDYTTASTMMPAAAARGLIGGLPDDAVEVALETCPTCPDHPPLVEFSATPEEIAAGMEDKIGRPMGGPTPMGQWTVRTCSPYDIFLPNCGIGLRYDDLPEVVECHVESLDWVALHYPEKAREVRPETPMKLSEYHPIAASPMLGAESGKIFNHHVRVKELHAKPFMVWDEQAKSYKLNKGRSIVVANGVVLLDTDLLMPSVTNKGEFVERAVYELIPWELREGAVVPYGLSLWELMCDAQENINEIAHQTAAVRERGVVPYVWTPRDADLQLLDRSGIPFTLISTQWSPEDGEGAVPRVIGGTTIAEGVYKERDYASGYLTNVSGRTEVEQGNVPGGVSAATAINILREESGTTRGKRIERIKAALRRTYSHGARLISAFWVEPRTIRYQEGDKERWERVKAMDFLGQTDVVLEPEPEFDSADQLREAVRDVITLGIDTSTPDGRLRARLIGAPSEMFDQENRQELNADREWTSFVTDKRRPIMDPTLDDPRIHWQEHGKRCDDERFLELEAKADWDKILGILGQSWDQDIQAAAMEPAPPLPTDMVQFPGPPAEAIDPATGAVVMQPSMQTMTVGAAVNANLMPAPPQPASLELRIEKKWVERLAAAGWAAKDPAQDQAAKLVFMWRSHAEAHRVIGEMKQAQAQAGPVMASPGAAETAAGTEVTPTTPASNVAVPGAAAGLPA